MNQNDNKISQPIRTRTFYPIDVHNMDFLYYEKIAARVCGVEPAELFIRTKKAERVLARFFCIAYRKEVLKIMIGTCATRYGLGHSDADHAIKSIHNYLETNKERADLYNSFLEQCQKIRETNPDKDQILMSIDDCIEKLTYLRSLYE